MTPYRDYTQAVCSCLRHATAEEKQAVAQELQDHLADHADALVEAGWDPEEAQAHALDAMGEAKEVGQALDQTFPRRWLVPLPGELGFGHSGGPSALLPPDFSGGGRCEQPDCPDRSL